MKRRGHIHKYGRQFRSQQELQDWEAQRTQRELDRMKAVYLKGRLPFGIMDSFGEGERRPGSTVHITPSPGMYGVSVSVDHEAEKAAQKAQREAELAKIREISRTTGLTLAAAAKMYGITLTDPVKDDEPKVNAKRNWGELFRNVGGGVYRIAQAATDGMTYGGNRSTLKPGDTDFEFDDVTGTQYSVVHHSFFTSGELTGTDEEIGDRLNNTIREALVAELDELLEHHPSAGKGANMPLQAKLRYLYVDYGLFPAFAISHKFTTDNGGDTYAYAFAIQWITNPDDEDDEDDD